METQMKKPLTNEDLIGMLNEATEAKVEPGTPGYQATPPPAPPDDQFQKLLPDKEQLPPEEEKPEPPAMPYDQQAKMLISFIEGIDILLLPYFYQKKLFSGEEIARLVELKKRLKEDREKPETVIEEADHSLYFRYVDYKSVCDKIPFSEAEVKLIQEPMAAIMEKYNFSVGPEALLLGALAMVMGPRFVPLFVG
jgi:hypothetical protein